MKSTWALVLTVAALAVSGAFIADEASAAQFPSVDEILDTYNPPNYSIDRFMDDTRTVFSPAMFKQMADYGGDLISFIVHDTFFADIGSDNLSDDFSGKASYINIFVLACLIIAIICVLGAFISYMKNRDTFFRHRED